MTLSPVDGGAFEAPTDTAEVDQYATTFMPGILAAHTGQPVRFQNSEDIHHNVRVVETATDSTWFNVVTVTGDPYTHTFTRTGWFDISCDMHPGMSAFLLVVDTPYAVVVDEDGAFSFDDVAPGKYDLTLWDRDSAKTLTRQVDISSDPSNVTFDSSR